MNFLSSPILYITCALALGFTLGFVLATLRTIRFKSELEAERKLHIEKLSILEQSAEKLGESFSALSSKALQQNNEVFLKLAEQNLSKHQTVAKNELEKREKSIENLVKPIRETLDKTERQLHSIEKERKESFGSLSEHLRQMNDSQLRLQRETQNLVSALRRPEVRGQWGEMTLKRLAELAGMSEYCDFSEQQSVNTENGLLRPDMIVRMPDKRELVIDAKTPLDAYLNAVQAEDESERFSELQRHARKLRERIKELASKAYWSQFKYSPDYVVLFVPGDHFLSAGLEQDNELLEYALSNKVVLATPTSLIALLRAVAFGWRQQAVARNADQIQSLGEELHQRMLTFVDHISKLGASLSNSVDHYNRAVGSLERSVLPGARKFTELGIESRKELSAAEQIEKTPRKISEK